MAEQDLAKLLEELEINEQEKVTIIESYEKKVHDLKTTVSDQ